MNSRYEVWLNGQPLSGISPDIYVADVSHEPMISMDTQARASGIGSFRSAQAIQGMGVYVTFSIEAYDPADRQEILNQVHAWALGGGMLTTRDRRGQRLRVVCDQFPSITSALKWTEMLSMHFVAYDWPYWEDEYPTETTVTAQASTATTATINCGGAFPTPLEFEIVPGASLTSLTVAVGTSSIALTGLSVAAETPVKLAYSDDRHIQSITAGTTSILDKRTSASADDLLLTPGANTITITGDAALTATLRHRRLTL